MDTQRLRLPVYKTAWMLDEGIDARKEVAMVKRLTPAVSAKAIARAPQLHGGLGMVEQTRLAQACFAARVAQVAESSTEIMKLAVAREVLEPPPTRT